MCSTSGIYTIITVGIIVAAIGGTALAEPPMGTVTATASNPGGQFKPAVAWNADAGRYLVVYERYQGADQEDVYAAAVSYSGTVFSPDLGIAGYAPEENQVDVAACGGSWMVAWKNGEDLAGKVFARPVADDFESGNTLRWSLTTQ